MARTKSSRKSLVSLCEFRFGVDVFEVGDEIDPFAHSMSRLALARFIRIGRIYFGNIVTTSKDVIDRNNKRRLQQAQPKKQTNTIPRPKRIDQEDEKADEAQQNKEEIPECFDRDQYSSNDQECVDCSCVDGCKINNEIDITIPDIIDDGESIIDDGDPQSIKATIQERGGNWYDVVLSSGEKVNKQALRKKDAESLINSL